MSTEKVWDDSSRDALRKQLCSTILGELRLAKREHDEILQTCVEVYIQDDCPEDEVETFTEFAADELERTAALVDSQQADWPEETDSDRLDRVEDALRERGIMLWQASPCCDSCTGGELPDRLDELDERFPGFRDRIRGYAFFIDQSLPESLAEDTQVSVFFAYGWWHAGDAEVAPELYEQNALAIAREVCECLRDEGFEVDWDGSFSRNFGITLNWQRRTMLQ